MPNPMTKDFVLREPTPEELRRAARAVAWHYRDEILAGDLTDARETMLALGLTSENAA
jgi:hypothetical protein